MNEVEFKSNGPLFSSEEFSDCGTMIARLFYHSEKEQQVRQNDIEKCPFVQVKSSFKFKILAKAYGEMEVLPWDNRKEPWGKDLTHQKL